jgi:hypothetical protein
LRSLPLDEKGHVAPMYLYKTGLRDRDILDDQGNITSSITRLDQLRVPDIEPLFIRIALQMADEAHIKKSP